MITPMHTCPACGRVVFVEPPGSYDICRVCGWEDDAVQLANPTSGGGANRESLVEAQVAALGLARTPELPLDPSWRAVSVREIAWHRSEREQAGTLWPNRADGLPYWQFPFEPVRSVPDWHDGPVAGIAELGGRPHRFRRRWSTSEDDYASELELTPITEEVAALEASLWALWIRWLDAFDAGRTDLATHPRLPEDRASYDAITAALTNVEPSPGSRVVAAANFRGDLRRCTDARVQWRPVEARGLHT